MPDTLTRILTALALALALMAGPTAVAAWSAPPVAAAEIDRLETQGYGIVSVRRSWLGRIVILATRDGVLREIVINRATGTVLSDRSFATAPEGTAPETGTGGPATDRTPGGASGSGTASNRTSSGGGDGGKDSGKGSGRDGGKDGGNGGH